MNKENHDFSLYEVFGKFMGKVISTDPALPLYQQKKTVLELTKAIKERAEDHGLKVNFVTGKRPDDIDSDNPETKNRLNIIAQPNPQGQQRIVEISIG